MKESSKKRHFRILAALMLLMAMLAGVPATALAQQSLQKKVTLNLQQTSARQVFSELKKQTGLSFVYSSEQAAHWPRVTVSAKGKSAREVVDAVAAQLGCSYQVNGNIVTLSKKKASGRKRRLTGIVSDDQGEPLAGVPVTFADGKVGTVTDAKGRYALSIPEDATVLKFSYVGMEANQITIAAGSKALQRNVTLQSDNSLSDVIVTGYQTLKKENATGSYQKITAKSLEQRYLGNVTSNLEGLVPGMVKYNNGVTNELTIRGVSTMSASTKPLVVVNGLPIEGTIEDLNPYEIESITILKDASAAAIYGARASNGVIVVVTKKADKGHLEVSFNTDITISDKQSYANKHWATAAEEMELNEYNFNDFMQDEKSRAAYIDNYNDRNGRDFEPFNRLMMRHYMGEISDADYEATKTAWAKNDYQKEWRDLMLRNQVTQQYSLALRTQGKYLNSNISVDYKADNTGMKTDHNQSLRLNYEGLLTPAKWMNMRFGLYVQSDRSKVLDESYGILEQGFGLLGITSRHAYESMWNADGTPAVLKGMVDPEEPALQNASLGFKSEELIIQDEIWRNYTKTRYTLFRPFVNLSVMPMDGLTLSGQFQYEDAYTKADTYYDGQSYMMRHLYNLYTSGGKHYLPEGGMLRTNTTEGGHYTFRTQASYSNTFSDVHAVEAVAGFEYRQTHLRTNGSELVGYDEQTQTNSNLMTNFYDLYNLQGTDLGDGFSPVGYHPGGNFASSDILHRYYSYYFTGGYTYDHRYSLSGSYRVDKADLFGADPKFRGRPLWSVGLSWNLHNESWMKPVSWVNMLKLRASHGLTGNIDSSISSYLTARIRTEYVYGGKRATLQTPPNDQLRWEKTSSWNAGADFALFDNRLYGSLDFYVKNSSDVLSNTDLDPATGWTSLTINNAKIQNKGAELQLTGIILPQRSRQDWGVDATLTLAHNKNKVKAVNHELTDIYDIIWNTDNYTPGRPVHSLWALQFGKIALDETGLQQLYFQKANGELVATSSLDTDLTAQDAVFMGSLDPKLTMALTPTVKWNGFALSGMFVLYTGHYMRMPADDINFTLGYYYGDPTTSKMVPNRHLLDYWRSGQSNDYIANGNAARNILAFTEDPARMDINVQHADYLKLRNLTLSYDLPAAWCRAIYAKSAKLRLQMDNVFCWARNSKSIDPETINPFTGATYLKTPRTYVMSVNINF